MSATTGSKYGDQCGFVDTTGCNTVYTSTYPYNPYLVPWTNSLFENAPADAIGVRMRWDQMGWQNKPIWCIGGDGAMFDIGFQALSRLFASGMNIKVFGLDTQVYSNTGGQARLAVDSRAFPILIYDPRKGEKVKERLSLQGNPAVKEDWFKNPKTNEEVSFIDFARSEGRFAKHFDKDGNPSETLLWAKQERLENWHLLQELAGLR